MNEWLNLVLGGGGVGIPVLGLVFWGKLLPSWVVNRHISEAEKVHSRQVEDLNTSHSRELTALGKSHDDALAARDRETERLVAERDYEREARNVERDRADANAAQLRTVTTEFGETVVHLLRSLPGSPDA